MIQGGAASVAERTSPNIAERGIHVAEKTPVTWSACARFPRWRIKMYMMDANPAPTKASSTPMASDI